jgi:5-methylthioribose kinase
MLEQSILDFLSRSDLLNGNEVSVQRMSGGVSSDIWRVITTERTFVVKRALPMLRVSQVWEAPLSRNGNEVKWLEKIFDIMPESVPRVFAQDVETATFAMEFLEFPVWKDRLRSGDVNIDFAAKVGSAIAETHSRTAGSQTIADCFSNSGTFDALRIDPYIIATSRVHPDLAEPLRELARNTLETNRTLVHGDVSPKNILVGPHSPIFLDAECAWYGEPAFDLAFCLNHLLLKCLWVRARHKELLSAFDALAESYLEKVDWEPRADIEARAARLLPALFLARIDGRSPVEYINEESDRQRIRQVAAPYILDPAQSLGEFRQAWMRKLADA